MNTPVSTLLTEKGAGIHSAPVTGTVEDAVQVDADDTKGARIELSVRVSPPDVGRLIGKPDATGVTPVYIRQIDILDRMQAAEFAREIAGLKQGHGSHGTNRSRRVCLRYARRYAVLRRPICRRGKDRFCFC
jgi:hypothetical protein